MGQKLGAIPKEGASFTPSTPNSAGAPPASKPPKAATPGAGGLAGMMKNPLALIGGLVVFLLIIGGGVFWALNREPASVVTPSASKTPQATKNVSLTYWGLWEPPEVMEALIDEYQKNNPGVKISYVQQKSDQYRPRTQAAIRDGSGPDIFRFHNTWLPMVQSDLAPAPKSVLSAESMTQEYYPIMARDLVKNNQVYGAPLMYEGLALLYNETVLQAANTQPPKDWEELRQLAANLTVKSGTQIERAGIALGSAANVDNFSDILGLMMLQNSGNPGNPVSDNERHALTFFTLFTRVDKVWDDSLPSSTVAFANEKAAMAILPSWRIFDIQQMNPNLKFGVARLPQLSDETITWGTYWAEGVSKASKNPEEAWKFLAWLSQPEQLRRFHSQAASLRGFGELYPRIEMAAELKENPHIAPYLEDALSAHSWYMASMTHDEGLNDKMIQYYTDAVNQMNTRGSAEQAFQQIVPGIQQVLSQYNITVGSAATVAP